MTKELKKRRDKAKEAWESAIVVMKKANRADDFMGSKKAHDEAEKLRVEYLKAEKSSASETETETDESETTLARSAHA